MITKRVNGQREEIPASFTAEEYTAMKKARMPKSFTAEEYQSLQSGENQNFRLDNPSPQPEPEQKKLTAENAWDAANDGVKQNTLMLLYNKQADRNTTPQEEQWIVEIEASRGSQHGFWLGNIETAGQMGSLVARSAEQSVKAGTVGATVGGTLGLIGGPGAPATVPAGMVAGGVGTFAASFPIFMAKNIYDVSRGEAWSELSLYNKENNLNLTYEQMNAAAGVVGLGVAALDIWSMGNVTKLFTPVGGQFAKKWLIASAARTMKNPSTIKGILAGGKNAAIAWIGEAVTEGMQKGIVELGLEGMRMWNEADFAEIAAGIGSSIATGAGGGSPPADIPAELNVDFPTTERMIEIWDKVVEEGVMAGKNMVLVSSVGGSVNIGSKIQEAVKGKKLVKDAELRFAENGATPQQIAEIRKSVPSEAIAQYEEQQQRKEQAIFKNAMNKIDTLENLTQEEQQSIGKHFGKDARAVAQGQRMELVREERDAIRGLEEKINYSDDQITDIQDSNKEADQADVVAKHKEQIVQVQEQMKARQANIERISGITRAVQQAKDKTTTLENRAGYYDSMANELEAYELGDSKEAEGFRKQADFAREDVITVQKELRKQKMMLLPKDSQQAKDVENMKNTLRSRKLPKPIRKALQAAYVNTTANVWSAMNSMFGPKVADEFNFEMEESSRNDAVDKVVERAEQEGARILKTKNFNATAIEMNNDRRKLTGPQGTVEVSTWDIMDLWTLNKNENSHMLLAEAYDMYQLQPLFDSLTDEQKAFADYLQAQVQPYFDVFNEWSIETQGVEIPNIPFYWPRKSIKIDGINTNDIFDHIKTVGEQPGPTKHRANSGVTPLPQNMWASFQQHIVEGEHVRHVSPKYERVKRALSDTQMKSIIENKFGKKVYGSTQALVDEMALNKISEHMDVISTGYGKLINNWAVAKIALSPTTFMRQLGSVTNYAEVMPAGEWATGFFGGLATPKQTFDFMWNNSEYIRRRYGRGYNEALADALEDAKKFGDKKIKLMKFLTSFGRTGDIGAIIYGGAPYVQNQITEYKQKNPNATEQEATNYAFAQLKKQTIRSQQSGLSSSLSVLQNSNNVFFRATMRFKNTPNQYVRKMVDAQIAIINGDITKKQYVKTMAVYGIIQPYLYVTLGEIITAPLRAIGGDDPDELMATYIERVFAKIATSPTAGIPVFGELIENVVMAIVAQDKRRAYHPVQIPVLDGFLHAIQMLTKNEISALDWMEIIAEIQEPIVPIPTGQIARYIDYVTED